MTRSEFMDSLHRTLAGSLTSSTVNENMRYYEEYFDTQLRMGQSEEDIVAELGDPRLLVRRLFRHPDTRPRTMEAPRNIMKCMKTAPGKMRRMGEMGAFLLKYTVCQAGCCLFWQCCWYLW